MIEIIPNFHPIFVHFTVALFSTSVGFSVLAYVISRIRQMPTLALEFEIVGRWCLWSASLITLVTISAGFYAYFTVKHDAISHAAMTVHRNWALLTTTIIILIACWSVWRYVQHKKLTWSFVIVLLIAQSLLLTTAWHGGELVYRYGVGVISLPQAEEIGHQHSHTTGMEHQSKSLSKANPNTNKHIHGTNEQH